jgi:ABC-type bacteriocin/lantibiotic exporter with double-glycine peptidase domain
MKTFLQNAQNDCGIACVLTVSNFYKQNVSREEISISAVLTTSGTSIYGLSKALQKTGFITKILTGATSDLPSLSPAPVILHWNNNHFVVLWKLRKHKSSQQALIGDPADGRNRWMNLEEVGDHWTGTLLWCQPGSDFVRGNFGGRRGVPGLLAHLRQFRGSWGNLLEIALSTLVLTLLGLGAPLLSQVLFDRVLTFREEVLLPYLLGAIFVLSAFQLAFTAVRGIIASHLSMRLDYRLHLGYFDHLMRLPMRQHESRLVGDLLQRFTDLSTVRGVLSSLIVSVPSAMFSLVISAIMLMMYNPSLALVASINIPLQLLYLLILAPQLRENSRRALKKSSQVQSFVLGSLEGLSTVKALRAESWAQERARMQVGSLMDFGWRGLMLNTWGVSVFGLLGNMSSLFTTWYGATQVLQLNLSVGQLVAANALMGSALGAFSTLTGSVLNVQEGVVASDRLAEILEIDGESRRGIKELPKLRNALEVSALRFGYFAERPMLKQVSFTLPKGSYTALLGMNGGGKSTLAAMLSKMLVPDAGRIVWDGIAFDDTSAYAVRERVLYVKQEVPVFYASLRENVALGADVDDATLWHAFEAAGLELVVRRLPDGLDTVVGGETLHKFSTGERQMLGLARALVSTADVLILDEPTATLDLERERRVLEVLKNLRGRKTLLVITHRPALLEPADQILHLEDGITRTELCFSRSTHGSLEEVSA